MFTGLIQNLGRLKNRVGSTFEFSAPLPESLKVGDSIAVNGICLTATRINTNSFVAELSQETLSKTAANSWAINQELNIEFPLTASAPLGGHIVQGHVDTVGTVTALSEVAESHEITVRFPDSLKTLIAPKGSITIDGVSLTINSVSPQNEFKVMIIPHTWNHTIIRNYTVNQTVNLEVDILAKYVQRAFDAFRETGVSA